MVPNDPVLLDIRPDGRAFLRGLVYRLAVFVPLIVVDVVSNRSATKWWVAVVLVLVAVGTLGYTVAMLRRSRVRLTPTSVRYVRPTGAERTLDRRGISVGVYARHYQVYGNGPASVLILAGPGNHRLLRLSGQLYAAADLVAFVQTFGPQWFDIISEPITGKRLAQRHPKLLPFYEARPGRYFALVMLALLVLIVVVSVIVLTLNPNLH